MEPIDNANDLAKKLFDMMKINQTEKLLQNNIVEFNVGNINYRVRKPTFQEREDIDKKKAEIYLTLLKDAQYVFEEQLIELYKVKNINIYKFDTDLIDLQRKIEELNLILAETTIESDAKKLESQIQDIINEQEEIKNKKKDLLQWSIEYKLDEKVNSFMTYYLLEKKENEIWIKAFKSYDDFLQNVTEELVIKSAYYLAGLLYHHV